MYIKGNIKRLMLYRLCLIKARESGKRKIFSYDLASVTGIAKEQIRKDFSNFNIIGRKKGGYDVDTLIDLLNIIFKRNESQHVVVIGVGYLGSALLQYISGFADRHQYSLTGFDIDKTRTISRSGIDVLPMDELEKFIKNNKVKIAILSLPGTFAQNICDKIVRYGIRGIMNFAPVVLKVPHDVIVNNINLCDELEGVIYATLSE